MDKVWNVKLAQRVLSFLLVVFILVIAVYKGPELLEAIKKVRLDWTFAGLGCYLVNYILRAIRLKIVSVNRLKLWPDTIHTVCFHGFATYMLPFRTGDLALPIILKTVSDISLADGGKLLFKVRLLDFSTLGFWMLGAAAFLCDSIPLPYRVAWFLIGLLMCITPLIIKQVGVVARTRLKGFLHYISVFETVGKVKPLECAVSLGIWAAVGACFYCTARAIGLTLGMGDIWFIITVQLPLQLIPLQGVANAGNHEGGWVAALALIGIPASEGLTFALTSHAILLSYVMVIGFVALIVQKKFK
jgi:glycosyltransferase 2 family protein